MNKREMEERITGLGAEVTALYEMREPKALAKEPEPQPTEFITVGEHRYRLMLGSPMQEAGRALREATLGGAVGHPRIREDCITKVERHGRGHLAITVDLYDD